MASCTSGQDKPTSALWLATQAGNIELSCLPGLPAISCKLNFPESHYNKVFIDQVWDQVGWILASFCFCEFMDLDSFSIHKHAKEDFGQYAAILTKKSLFNDPYLQLCALSYLAYDFKQGWRWPSIETDLSAFLM